MDQRTLGESSIEVGAVGLGCMGMSWAYNQPDGERPEHEAVIRRAVELGMTLIDTADMYGPYANEELVGRAIAGLRDRVTLATKGGLVDAGKGELGVNGRPENIRAACEQSLSRLGVDAIDLYQLHRVDPNVPVEETWGAIAELIEEGRVRAAGMSDATVEQLERAHATHPVTSVQSELSIWTREPLDKVLPWCSEHGVAFIAYAPLGRGFLTGSFGPDHTFQDLRAGLPRFQEDALAANQAIVETVRAVADRHGATPGQVALAWVLAQGGQVVPIPGTTKVGHLEDNAAAAELRLSADDLAELDSAPQPVGAAR